MRDEWIAVARGLRCLALSIQLNIIAFWLAVTAFVFLFLQFFMGPRGVMLPLHWLLLPAGGVALIAFIYSRMARLLLMRTPRCVPAARFCVMAALVVGLIGQTGLGGFIALGVARAWIDLPFALLWFGLSLFFTCTGAVFFQRALYKIAVYTQNPQTPEALKGTWVITIFGWCLIAVGIAILWTGGSEGALVILGAFTLAAVIVLGIATVLYSSAVHALGFSALRQAVQCGDTSDRAD